MKTTPSAATNAVVAQLNALSDPTYAAVSRRFFKTGPGQYGAEDLFLGIRVPTLRALARQWGHLTPMDAAALLDAPVHEQRFLALLMMIGLYRKGKDVVKQRIFDLYLENTEHVNSWDLVDLSAPHIVGQHLLERDKTPLYRLARSQNLWERRIAVVATFCDIRHGRFDHTLAIAQMLLNDRQDLIHKAVGWMLREIGKRDPAVEKDFLTAHCRRMPRTMLRYAIERFPEVERRQFLKGGHRAKDPQATR